MNTTRYLTVLFLLLALFIASPPVALAQGNIAIEKRIHVSRGKTRTIRGRTDSTTSYVYKLRARKDQALEVRLTSEGEVATFSIVPPAPPALENAAGVKQWSGTLTEDGDYSIIVAISSKGLDKVAYTLEVTGK